jgi:hypothetical protein
MSVWTHVAAVFRIDGIKSEYSKASMFMGDTSRVWDKVIGRTIREPHSLMDADSYEVTREREDWDAYRKEPMAFVPTGSEGSLKRLVWVNKDRSSAARYTVTVFGDLRDYEDADKIKEWFEAVCSKCYIRQAVCHCEVEGVGTYTWESSWTGLWTGDDDDE